MRRAGLVGQALNWLLQAGVDGRFTLTLLMPTQGPSLEAPRRQDETPWEEKQSLAWPLGLAGCVAGGSYCQKHAQRCATSQETEEMNLLFLSRESQSGVFSACQLPPPSFTLPHLWQACISGLHGVIPGLILPDECLVQTLGEHTRLSWRSVS